MISLSGKLPKLHLLRPLAVTAGYLFLLLLVVLAALVFRRVPDVTNWYPPSGLSFALLLVFGPEYAPLVFLSVLLTALGAYGIPLSPYLIGVAALSAVVYAGAAAALRRLIPELSRLFRLRETILFVLVSICAPLLLAAASATLLVMSGDVSPFLYGENLFNFWLWNTLGNLAFTPFLWILFFPLTNRSRSSAPARKERWTAALNKLRAEGRSASWILMQAAATGLLVWILFGLRAHQQPYFWYLLFLPLLWVVLFFGLRGAIFANLGICVATISAVSILNYPLASSHDLQMFLLMLSMIGLITGAAFSERREAERALRYRVGLEEKIAVISSNFIHIKMDRADAEIQKAMQGIGEFTQVDASHLLIYGAGRKIERVYEWTSRGVQPRVEALTGMSMTSLPWMMSQLEQGQDVYIPDLSALPPEAAAEREHFIANHLSAIVTVPLRVGPRLVGSLGFHSSQGEKHWLAEDIRLLHLLAEIFLNVIEKQRVESQVRESDLKFRSIVLQSYDGIALVDENHHIIEWNRGMERISGIKRSESLGRLIWDIQFQAVIPERRTPENYERIKRIAIDGQSNPDAPWMNQLNEMEIMQPNGERRRVQSLVFPIHTSKGSMYGNITRDVTDLRRGEAQLQSSQDSLAEAERLAHLGHFRFTIPDGKMEWSEETRRIFKWPEQSGPLDLQACLARIFPEDLEPLLGKIDRILEDKRPADGEYRIWVDEGQMKVLYSIAQPVMNEAGEVTHIFGTIMDITERKLAEEAARESETRYKELADSISDVFFGLDTNMRVTYWNKASEEMMHLPAAQALGRALDELFPQVRGTTIEQFIREAFRTQQHQGLVVEYKIHGKKVFVEINAYPSQNGLSVFLRDVTERQEAQGRLRQSEARYRAVVEDQTDLILRFLPDGTITFVNEAFCKNVGKSRRQLVGQKFIRFHSAYGEKEMAGQVTSLHGGRANTYETQMYLLDGKVHWIQWTDRAISDTAGLVTEFQSVGRDITESKRLEEELRYISTHDVLTGIYNRTFFETEISRLQRGRHYPISILIVDVNGLKYVNDTYGHPAGDELLRRAARVLSSCFRTEDIVARYGGDEFAVLLPGSDAQMAEEVLQRVRASLDVYNRGTGGPALSLSLGIATGDRGAVLLEVLSLADERMYMDKERQKMSR